MNRILAAALLPALLAACGSAGDTSSATAAAQASDPAADAAGSSATIPLDAAIAADWRTPEFAARDRYRNPGPTLRFFGLQPGQTVVEINPYGGWYTEILAPYLRDRGRYVAALVDPGALPEDRRGYATRGLQALEEKFAASPALYDRARIATYDPASPRFGEPGSADLVLTFRNVHSWRGAGQAEAVFRGFHEVLKPGGTLGVVQHRAAADVADDDRSGYVGQAQVIALAEAAGFRFDADSEINANPRDTRDHPNGVWTLPPTSNHDEADAEKYRRIGESDRMTLRFVKPE